VIPPSIPLIPRLLISIPALAIPTLLLVLIGLLVITVVVVVIVVVAVVVVAVVVVAIVVVAIGGTGEVDYLTGIQPQTQARICGSNGVDRSATSAG